MIIIIIIIIILLALTISHIFVFTGIFYFEFFFLMTIKSEFCVFKGSKERFVVANFQTDYDYNLCLLYICSWSSTQHLLSCIFLLREGKRRVTHMIWDGESCKFIFIFFKSSIAQLFECDLSFFLFGLSISGGVLWFYVFYHELGIHCITEPDFLRKPQSYFWIFQKNTIHYFWLETTWDVRTYFRNHFTAWDVFLYQVRNT